MEQIVRMLHKVAAIVHSLWYITVPYKDLNYLRTYFYRVEQIDSNHQIRFQIQTILVVIVVKMLQQFHLIITPMSHLTRLLMLDFFYINHMPSEFNILNILMLALALYYYYIAYLVNYSKVFIGLAAKVLIAGEDDFFPQKYIKDEPVHRFVRRLGFVVLNVLQFFVLVINLSILCTQIFIVHQLYHNWFTFISTTPHWLIVIVLIQANAFLHYVCLHALIHVCNLLGTISITTATICFIRLRQTGQLLYRAHFYLHWSDLLHFISTHIESLRLIFRLSKIYGNLLLAFIAINVPLNCTILVALWIDKMPLVHRFFAVVILMAQFGTLIGNHLIAALFPKRIHQPIKRLIHLSIIARRSGCLISKLKVAQYIEHFHTDNQYGINYGPTGFLVTLGAFFKFLLFYSQTLMFSYQLIRGAHFYN